MLYLFDLDGTLISGYMDNPDKDYNTWDVLPKRQAMLNKLLMQGDTICIITNQAGVAFGYVTEDQADAKISQALLRLGLLNPRWSSRQHVFACYHHPDGKGEWSDPVFAHRRKPSPAMLLEAIAEHPHAASFGVLMVGDRQEDYDAAQAAQVSFQWAHVFFKDEAAE